MVHTLDKNDVNREVQTELKPKKFMVWLFIVSSMIMFGGFTSYYIVFSASKGKGHGLVLPDLFIYSTLVLVISSVCLFVATRALKSGNVNLQRTLLWSTLVLGLAFGYLQITAWSVMVSTGAFFSNNNAAISMIYVVSGFHLIHIFAGVCFLINAIVGTYLKITPERQKFRMEIASIFWHFIDILWIYLYVFLLLNS